MPILKQLLFDTYDGFADKRVKDLTKSSIFIVDDRTSNDEGSGGKLYSSFCMIFADVKSSNQVEVSLRGNVPEGEKLREWADKHGLTIDMRLQRALVFTIEPGEQEMLDDLASAIESLFQKRRACGLESRL